MHAASLTANQTKNIVIAAAVIWVFLSLLVAVYGHQLGYPAFPLLLVALVLGPVGWALVLLGVVLASGPRLPTPQTWRCPMCAELIPNDARVCGHCGREVRDRPPES